MEAGEEKGGWESGFFFLIFTDIVKKWAVGLLWDLVWDTNFRPQKTRYPRTQKKPPVEEDR